MSAPSLGRVIRTKSAPRAGESQRKYKKPRSAVGAPFLLIFRLASRDGCSWIKPAANLFGLYPPLAALPFTGPGWKVRCSSQRST